MRRCWNIIDVFKSGVVSEGLDLGRTSRIRIALSIINLVGRVIK